MKVEKRERERERSEKHRLLRLKNPSSGGAVGNDVSGHHPPVFFRFARNSTADLDRREGEYRATERERERALEIYRDTILCTDGSILWRRHRKLVKSRDHNFNYRESSLLNT